MPQALFENEADLKETYLTNSLSMRTHNHFIGELINNFNSWSSSEQINWEERHLNHCTFDGGVSSDHTDDALNFSEAFSAFVGTLKEACWRVKQNCGHFWLAFSESLCIVVRNIWPRGWTTSWTVCRFIHKGRHANSVLSISRMKPSLYSTRGSTRPAHLLTCETRRFMEPNAAT